MWVCCDYTADQPSDSLISLQKQYESRSNVDLTHRTAVEG
jgi:hypothetical protein